MPKIYKIRVNNKDIEIERSEGTYRFKNHKNTNYEIEPRGKEYHVIMDDKSYVIDLSGYSLKSQFTAFCENLPNKVQYQSTLLTTTRNILLQSGKKANSDAVTSPMPGKVLKLLIQEGDTVTEDQPIVILEAMKMENVIKSSRDGEVKEVKVSEGDHVDKNQTIITF